MDMHPYPDGQPGDILASVCSGPNRESETIALRDAWVIELYPVSRSGRGRFERENHCGYTDSVWRAGLYTEAEASRTAAMFPHKYNARSFYDVLHAELTSWGDPSNFSTEARLRLALEVTCAV